GVRRRGGGSTWVRVRVPAVFPALVRRADAGQRTVDGRVLRRRVRSPERIAGGTVGTTGYLERIARRGRSCPARRIAAQRGTSSTGRSTQRVVGGPGRATQRTVLVCRSGDGLRGRQSLRHPLRGRQGRRLRLRRQSMLGEGGGGTVIRLAGRFRVGMLWTAFLAQIGQGGHTASG